MKLVGNTEDIRGHYEIMLPCLKSGRIGYTVRVIPDAKRMSVKHETLLIKWADL